MRDFLGQVWQSIARRLLTYVLAFLSMGAGATAFVCIGALEEAVLAIGWSDLREDPLFMRPSLTASVHVPRDESTPGPRLRPEQLAAVVREVTGREVAQTEVYHPLDLKFRRWAWSNIQIIAVSGNAFSAGFRRSDSIVRGRPISVGDDQEGRFVCLINARIAEQIPTSDDLVGRTLRLGGRAFRIIGISARRDLGEDVMIPLSVGRSSFPEHYTSGSVAAFSTEDRLAADMDRVEARLNGLTGSDHHWRIRYDKNAAAKYRASPERKRSAFSLYSMWLQAAQLRRQHRLLRLEIGGVATGTLMAGLLGMVSMLLANLGNRKVEIGLHRALGATRWRQASQVLAEAAIIGALGGGLGALQAVGVLKWLRTAFDMQLTAPTSWLVAAVLTSTVTAVLAGAIPCRAAMRLSPIEALRFP